MLNLEGEEERKMKMILTLGELEALAGLGLTGLLTFNDARVAGHEAFGAEGGRSEERRVGKECRL